MHSVSDLPYADISTCRSPRISSNHASNYSRLPSLCVSSALSPSPSPSPTPEYTTSYCPIKDLTTVSKTSNNSVTAAPIATPAMSTNGLKLNDKTFTEKSEIKPWLQKELRPTGIDIVIERSDDTKIVFKCKYQSNPKSKSKSKSVCPFRIRANYSIRLKLWTLVVVNKNHNHVYSHNKTSSSTSRVTKPQTVPTKLLPATLTPKIPPLSDSNVRNMLRDTNNFNFNVNTSHLNLNVQIRKIEDTLKSFQHINCIPEDSKERILNNVLLILNDSINEASTNTNINTKKNTIILPPLCKTLLPPPLINGELIKLPKIKLNNYVNARK